MVGVPGRSKGCCTCRRRKRGVRIVRSPYYPVLPAPAIHLFLPLPEMLTGQVRRTKTRIWPNAGMPVWCARVNTSGSKAGSIGESLLKWEACFDHCSLTNLDRRSWQYRRGRVRSGELTCTWMTRPWELHGKRRKDKLIDVPIELADHPLEHLR